MDFAVTTRMADSPDDVCLSDVTIMVVDDKPANLKLLNGMLRQLGFRVLSFPRGNLALAAVADHPPDLLLLDINMPELDGFEVCRQLKAQRQFAELPVIFISAHDNPAERIKALQLGGADYIVKPYQIEEVESRVRTQLLLYRLKHQQRRAAEGAGAIRKIVEAALESSDASAVEPGAQAAQLRAALVKISAILSPLK